MARKLNYIPGPGRPANMDNMLTHRDTETGQDLWRAPFSQDADCDVKERAFQKDNAERRKLPPSA